MDASTTSFLTSASLLLALGFRHGMDPDHIAVIDGLTRFHFSQQAYWSARLTGFQFACGHSLTIFLASAFFYWQEVQLPPWLDALGLWLSSTFLLWLALLNLRHCVAGPSLVEPHRHRLLAGRIGGALLRTTGPLAHPLGVGFAFALSLDTMAQAGLMATKGHALGGLGMVFLLVACFGTGMLLADTGNGLLMHWLVRGSERVAQQAARVMSGVVATLALLVLGVNHGKEYFGALQDLWENQGLWLGAGMMLTTLLAYFLSRRHYQVRLRSNAVKLAGTKA